MQIRVSTMNYYETEIVFNAETANMAETLKSPDATKTFYNWANLILYCEESLVSSNLDSKLLCFHSIRPNACRYQCIFVSNTTIQSRVYLV